MSMKVICTGSAIIVDDETEKQFEIAFDELDWEMVDSQPRGDMGPQNHYRATIDHEVLGHWAWNLWEYPRGVQNDHETEKGNGSLIQDFEYCLEAEDEGD